MLQAYQINIYISPLNLITYNASKNFVSKEFIGYANSIAILTKCVLVEAHQLVRLVERAHPTLQRAYQVILDKLYSTLTKDLVLQIAVKAVNDTTSLNGLVLTLLVFSTYFRMTKLDPPTSLITAYTMAIRKAMAKITKLQAYKLVNTMLHHQNKPNTTPIYNLPLNLEVLVQRKGNIG